MATTSKKRAAKIAKKVIEQASKNAAAARPETPELIARMEAAARQGETEGRDAFANLRRLRGEKLPRGEEVLIATRLYAELPALKRNLQSQRIGIGDFCIRHGISDASESSKELHRLTLAPDKDPKSVRLRRAAAKYRVLIEAISKVTRESVSSLADRVLLGTSLHPSKLMASLSEAEKVQTALQRIVDKIDAEFRLFEKFMDVAALRAKHLRDGGKEYWPMADPNPAFQPSDDLLASMIPAPSADDLAREHQIQGDPQFAFWRPPFFDELNGSSEQLPSSSGEGILQDNDFFFVPHAPLGIVIMTVSDFDLAKAWWRCPRPEGGSILAIQESISDDWNGVDLRPTGQLPGDEDNVSRGTEFAWLVIYPTRDGSRLMPMFYVSFQEGGPYLLPLDARNLELLREAMWMSQTEESSVFDRIKALLGHRPGARRVIEDGWRRTAPWLDHNPHFKRERAKLDDLKLLEDFCQQLWDERR